MKRILVGSFVLALTLLGCAEIPDSELRRYEPDVVEVDEESPGEPTYVPGNPDPSGCGLYAGTAVELGDEVIVIPVECEEFYLETGRPLPSEPKPERFLNKSFSNES